MVVLKRRTQTLAFCRGCNEDEQTFGLTDRWTPNKLWPQRLLVKYINRGWWVIFTTASWHFSLLCPWIVASPPPPPKITYLHGSNIKDGFLLLDETCLWFSFFILLVFLRLLCDVTFENFTTTVHILRAFFWTDKKVLQVWAVQFSSVQFTKNLLFGSIENVKKKISGLKGY